MLREVLEFNQIALRTKKDVLREVDRLIRCSDNDGYIAFLERFKNSINDATIPSLKTPYHAYEMEISSYEALLYEIVFREVTIKDGEIQESDCTLYPPLVTTKAKLLSVEQYAASQGVKPLTVRQWIRRGKLCDAKKVGGEWFIPATENRPGRGYLDASFAMPEDEYLDGEIANRFPYLHGASNVDIAQREDDKAKFDIWVRGKEPFVTVTIDAKEREALVLALTSHPKTISDGSVQYITEKSQDLRGFIPTLSQSSSALDESVALVLVETPHRYSAIGPNDGLGADCEASMEHSDLKPVAWKICCFQKEQFAGISDNWYEHRDEAIECGLISGYFIDCGGIRLKGKDPLVECDDVSSDLEYMAESLFCSDGPLGEEGYDPYACAFYLGGIYLKEQFKGLGIETRLLRELPYLCQKFLGTAPSVLTWIEGPEDKEQHLAERLFEPSGFTRHERQEQLFIAYSWL